MRHEIGGGFPKRSRGRIGIPIRHRDGSDRRIVNRNLGIHLTPTDV